MWATKMVTQAREEHSGVAPREPKVPYVWEWIDSHGNIYDSPPSGYLQVEAFGATRNTKGFVTIVVNFSVVCSECTEPEKGEISDDTPEWVRQLLDGLNRVQSEIQQSFDLVTQAKVVAADAALRMQALEALIMSHLGELAQTSSNWSCKDASSHGK